MTVRQIRYEAYRRIWVRHGKDLALLDQALDQIDAAETDPCVLAFIDKEWAPKPGSGYTLDQFVDKLSTTLEGVMFATPAEREFFFETIKFRSRPSRN